MTRHGGFLVLQAILALWVLGGMASFLGCDLGSYRCAPGAGNPTGVLVMLGIWALVDLAWLAWRGRAP